MNKKSLLKLKAEIEEKATYREQYLRRPLTIWEEIVIQWSILWIQTLRSYLKSYQNPKEVDRANRCFSRLFPNLFTEIFESFLNDPEAYLIKVRTYDFELKSQPKTYFKTNQIFDNLIMNDPLRIREKDILCQALSMNQHLDQDPFRVIDLGMGSGRMAYNLAEILFQIYPEKNFLIVGLDIDIENIKASIHQLGLKKFKQKLGNLVGDIVKSPFGSETVSLCFMCSVIQLVALPYWPYIFAEMLRILKTNADGLITGPNEKCSLETFIRSSLASQPELYCNPFLALDSLKLAPVAIHLQEMVQNRLDHQYLDTQQTCSVLERMGCEIIDVQTWPQFRTNEDIFSAIHFRKTMKTNKLIHSLL